MNEELKQYRKIDAHQRTTVGLQLHAVVLGSLFEDDFGHCCQGRLYLVGAESCAGFHLPAQFLVRDDVLASLR